MAAERTLESVTGERMVIKESTPDLLRFERHLPPKQRPVPKVAHPTQQARLHVLEGRLHGTVGGTTRDYAAGESLTVPARPASDRQALGELIGMRRRCRWVRLAVVGPALGGGR